MVSHLRPPAARQPQSSIRICVLTQSVPVGSGFCRHVGRAAEACSQACALGSAPSCFRPLGLHALYATENSIFGGASCRAARSEDLHCCWPSSQLGEQLAPFHAPLAIASLAWVLLHDRSISFVLSRRSDDVRRLPSSSSLVALPTGFTAWCRSVAGHVNLVKTEQQQPLRKKGR